MILLETKRLIIRNWQDEDRPFFHFRRTREQADVRMNEISAGIDQNGFGFACAALKSTGEPIGFIGLHRADHLDPHIPAGSIEIGWRLAPQHWRKGYASEGARGWLKLGFEKLDLEEIVSIAVWNNLASISVMQRIGMKPDPASDFNHPQAPADQPDFERVVVYRLSQTDWLALQPADLTRSARSRNVARRSWRPASKARSCGPDPSAS